MVLATRAYVRDHARLRWPATRARAISDLSYVDTTYS